MKTHTSMNTNILGQEMAFEATKVPRKFINDQLKIWQERRYLLYAGLKDAGLDLWNPEGAFYMLPNISKFGLSSIEFTERLLDEKKVAAVPGAAFGCDSNIRLSYACSRDNIEEGVRRLAEFTAAL